MSMTVWLSVLLETSAILRKVVCSLIEIGHESASFEFFLLFFFELWSFRMESLLTQPLGRYSVVKWNWRFKRTALSRLLGWYKIAKPDWQLRLDKLVLTAENTVHFLTSAWPLEILTSFRILTARYNVHFRPRKLLLQTWHKIFQPWNTYTTQVIQGLTEPTDKVAQPT